MTDGMLTNWIHKAISRLSEGLEHTLPVMRHLFTTKNNSSQNMHTEFLTYEPGVRCSQAKNEPVNQTSNKATKTVSLIA